MPYLVFLAKKDAGKDCRFFRQGLDDAGFFSGFWGKIGVGSGAKMAALGGKG